jgi:uncharacterized protein (TIGR03083 family)
MTPEAQKQLANIAVVASESARMTRAFQSWPESYWQRPTYCPGWQALDAVAHLATGGDFYTQVIAAGQRGTPSLPWGLSDIAGFRAVRGEATKKLVAAGPEALVRSFAQNAASLQEVFDALQPDDLSKVAWHPRGLVPIGAWIGMRLNELVIHDWDIRQPHEADAGLAPTALAAMLTILPEMQLQFLTQRVTDDMDGVYVLCADAAAWAFTIRGKSVTYQAQLPVAYDACVHADANSLILLTMGRADADAKRHRGLLTTTGNIEKAQRLCATLFRTF